MKKEKKIKNTPTTSAHARSAAHLLQRLQHIVNRNLGLAQPRPGKKAMRELRVIQQAHAICTAACASDRLCNLYSFVTQRIVLSNQHHRGREAAEVRRAHRVDAHIVEHFLVCALQQIAKVAVGEKLNHRVWDHIAVAELLAAGQAWSLCGEGSKV